MANEKVILITGASSGIGAATAKHMNEHGYKVYGTSRKATNTTENGITMLELDVTDDDSTARCVKEVIEREGRLDVVVNNAGYGHMGPVEDSSVDDLKAQFETNLYGVHRVIRAALPQMFAQGGGRLVNISSAVGRTAWPLMSVYCSSKFALEGYTEGLAKELEPHGIQAVIVEPGVTVTGIEQRGSYPANISERYAPAMQQLQEGFAEMMKQGDSAETVAEVIRQAVEDEKPELRYVCPNAKAILSQAGA